MGIGRWCCGWKSDVRWCCGCQLYVLDSVRDGVLAAWCGFTRLVNAPLAGDAFFCCSIPLMCK